MEESHEPSVEFRDMRCEKKDRADATEREGAQEREIRPGDEHDDQDVAEHRNAQTPRRFAAGFFPGFDAFFGAPAGYSPAFFSRTDQYSQARACGRGCRLRSHAMFASPGVSGLKAWPCALHIS